jgi:hypothetical protein
LLQKPDLKNTIANNPVQEQSIRPKSNQIEAMASSSTDIATIEDALNNLQLDETRIKKPKRSHDGKEKPVTSYISEDTLLNAWRTIIYQNQKANAETIDQDTHIDSYGRTWHWKEYEHQGEMIKDWFTKWFDDMNNPESQYTWYSWTSWKQLQTNNQ